MTPIIPGNDNSTNCNKEDILAVPKVWTKKAYNLLLKHNAVPRPWHLEGRWGSRTHSIDEHRMGFPIISADSLLQLVEAETTATTATTAATGTSSDTTTMTAATELGELILKVPGVELLRQQPFVESKRARDNPFFDATIHPEKERPTKRPRYDTTVREVAAPLQPPFLPVPTTKSNNNETKEAFTYAELFCGIGGFGVALEALGGKCLMVSELEEACRELYRENFPNTPRDRIFGDIYQVKDTDFPERGTLDLLV
jgi:C-5 cytosine-specific DNA methylase